MIALTMIKVQTEKYPWSCTEFKQKKKNDNFQKRAMNKSMKVGLTSHWNING
jgi:hypothetical protein